MRNFWAMEFPVGDPLRGPAFGERTDPASIGISGAMSGIGTAMGVISNISAGRVARRQGEAAQAAANFEAAQMDQAAGQQIASAQRAALEQKRRAALIVSRGLAVSSRKRRRRIRSHGGEPVGRRGRGRGVRLESCSMRARSVHGS